MITRNISHIAWVLFLILSSCIEDYNPKLTEYEDLFVVDGRITNEDGPQTVRLSISSNVLEPEFIPVEYATVQITDNFGNKTHLDEIEPGVYQTDSSMTGIIGRSYKIEISTENGKFYQSDFEELKNPTGIEDVYHEVESKYHQNFQHDLIGYRFYVDSKEAEEKENYYFWDLEATYHYESDFTVRWYFDGELHWFHGPDSLYNCWTTYKVNQIFLSHTNNLIQPRIVKYPFHFVSTETRELSVRYSLLVKQLSISEVAYDYWDDVKRQNGDVEGLYTTLPYLIRGNVKNINDANELVLGYFMVAGVTEERIFVERPPSNVPMYYSVCQLTEADFEAYGQMYWMDPVYYPIYAIETNGGRRATPHQACVDCRRKGGTINKPDFWIY